MTDAEMWDNLVKMSEAHHIRYEFQSEPYRMAEEIARLRKKCGETICPVFAPLSINRSDDGDCPF
jgi:hypothetical protein